MKLVVHLCLFWIKGLCFALMVLGYTTYGTDHKQNREQTIKVMTGRQRVNMLHAIF